MFKLRVVLSCKLQLKTSGLNQTKRILILNLILSKLFLKCSAQNSYFFLTVLKYSYFLSPLEKSIAIVFVFYLFIVDTLFVDIFVITFYGCITKRSLTGLFACGLHELKQMLTGWPCIMNTRTNLGHVIWVTNNRN